ncbi:MAG: 4'-phosphopantetheinyl transferase family protein [Candidatus Sericytochromatia bacterium]
MPSLPSGSASPDETAALLLRTTLARWELRSRFELRTFIPLVPLFQGPTGPLSLPPALASAAPKRQAEYLAGRACLQSLYAQAGLPWQDPPHDAQRAPVWPLGWTGSLSHSADCALAVLASRAQVRAVGVDVETCMSAETAARVRASLLHPDEEVLVPAGEAGRERLTLIFSFKESFYKALAPLLGRFIGFQELAVTEIVGERLSCAPRGPLCADFPVAAPRQGWGAVLAGRVVSAYEWAEAGGAVMLPQR